MSVNPQCQVCDGVGFYTLAVPYGNPQFGKLQACACNTDRANRMQAACNLTDLERGCRLEQVNVGPDHPGAARMVELAHAFVAEPRGMLTFHGGVGNAKSVVLCAVVNACLARGVAAVYLPFVQLIKWLQECYEVDTVTGRRIVRETAAQRIEQLQRVPVLCLDEFDGQKVKESAWVAQIEMDLIDWRYRYGLSGQCGTLLAMNSHPSRLPEAVYSRLRDGRNSPLAGVAPIVHNADADLRPLLAR